MHGTIFIRKMTREDNEKVARFILNVYDPWRWFWPQLLYGVVFVRRKSPLFLVASVCLLFCVTDNFLLSVVVVSLVVFALSVSLTYQFWMYVKRHPDVASKTIFEKFCVEPGEGFWVATCCEECRDGRLLGTAALTRKSEREAEIFRMAVAIDAGRKGIASKLLETVERFAAEHDYETLELWTSNAQYKGLRFYQSRGFRIVERRWHTNRPMPISVNVLKKWR